MKPDDVGDEWMGIDYYDFDDGISMGDNKYLVGKRTYFKHGGLEKEKGE